MNEGFGENIYIQNEADISNFAEQIVCLLFEKFYYKNNARILIPSNFFRFENAKRIRLSIQQSIIKFTFFLDNEEFKNNFEKIDGGDFYKMNDGENYTFKFKKSIDLLTDKEISYILEDIFWELSSIVPLNFNIYNESSIKNNQNNYQSQINKLIDITIYKYKIKKNTEEKVVFNNDLLSQIQEIIENFKTEKFSSDSIKGHILYGPPRTGKTLLSKNLAKENQDIEFFELFLSDFLEEKNMTYGGEKTLNVFLDYLKKYLEDSQKPLVLFINDFEDLGVKVKDNSQGKILKLVGKFIYSLDENIPIKVFCTTNKYSPVLNTENKDDNLLINNLINIGIDKTPLIIQKPNLESRIQIIYNRIHSKQMKDDSLVLSEDELTFDDIKNFSETLAGCTPEEIIKEVDRVILTFIQLKKILPIKMNNPKDSSNTFEGFLDTLKNQK